MEDFKDANIVYLSPDGEEELKEIREDEVYVIGGLVDRYYWLVWKSDNEICNTKQKQITGCSLCSPPDRIVYKKIL